MQPLMIITEWLEAGKYSYHTAVRVYLYVDLSHTNRMIRSNGKNRRPTHLPTLQHFNADGAAKQVYVEHLRGHGVYCIEE